MAPRKPRSMHKQAIADRRERFAHEIASGAGGAEAAITAGFAPRSAHVTASRLLSDDKVSARIAELRGPVQEKLEEKLDLSLEITAAKIKDELRRIAFTDIRQLFVTGEGGVLRMRDIEEWPEDLARSISSVKVKRIPAKIGGTLAKPTYEAEHDVLEIRFWDKPAALVKLGQDLGMFQVQHKHKHLHRFRTAEDRAQRVAQILGIAASRRAATGSGPALVS